MQLARIAIVIIVVFFAVGVTAVVLSYFMFNGLWATLHSTCGSACEVWPGIPTSQICNQICVLRNGLYKPFFFAGVAACVVPIVYLLIKRFAQRR